MSFFILSPALEPRICTRWDMHRYAREAYDLGVRYIGGCCGFEAYHVRALAEELAQERGKKPKASEKHDEWGGGLKMHTKPWVRARWGRNNNWKYEKVFEIQMRGRFAQCCAWISFLFCLLNISFYMIKVHVFYGMSIGHIRHVPYVVCSWTFVRTVVHGRQIPTAKSCNASNLLASNLLQQQQIAAARQKFVLPMQSTAVQYLKHKTILLWLSL